MLQSDLIRTDEITAIQNLVNTYLGTAGVIEFWTGAIPAFTTDPDTGTLLGTLNLDNPAIVVNGLTSTNFGTIVATTAVASGTMGYARLKDSGGTCVFQCTVAVTSGGDFNFNTLSVTAGDTIALSLATWQTNIVP